MASLYADENFPLPAVIRLRELGHDVLTPLESGQAGSAVPDEDVLAFATAQNRCLLTINRKHFIRLHTSKPQHAGIVVCTFDADFAGLAARIHEALGQHPTTTGRLIRVNRPP